MKDKLCPIVLGLDLGTSGVRVVAVEAQGYLIAQSSHAYPLATPRPSWTEQNPADWVQASIAALQDIALQLPNAEIVALGLYDERFDRYQQSYYALKTDPSSNVNSMKLFHCIISVFCHPSCQF
ncbi:FGGY family carbohydrate kinase [Phormidesmis sp. 146-33]